MPHTNLLDINWIRYAYDSANLKHFYKNFPDNYSLQKEAELQEATEKQAALDLLKGKTVEDETDDVG